MKYLSYLLIPLYLIGWLGTAGTVNYDIRTQFHSLDESRYHAHQDWVFSLIWSATPVFPWIIAPILNSTEGQGWTLTNEPFPCTEKYKDLWCKGNY